MVEEDAGQDEEEEGQEEEEEEEEDHFGPILGAFPIFCFWFYCPYFLGVYFRRPDGPIGSPVGSLWPLWALFGRPSGSFWEALGVILGSILGLISAILGHVGHSGCLLDRLGSTRGPMLHFWVDFGPL